MCSKRQNLRKNTKAASPAVSAIVITAATVVLVLISSIYALQVLTRQEAGAEFETTQNSILVFDDSVRDIAWDRGGSRSVRFAVKYGNMLLINESKRFEINASGFNEASDSYKLYEFSTAVVKYQMPYGYGTSGTGTSYILGDISNVVSRLPDSLGQALVEYKTDFASVTLNYRVRVTEEGSVVVNSSTTYHYVDIFVIRLTCNSSEIEAGDFDLVCKNVGLETISSNVYKVSVNATHPTISVSYGGRSDQVVLDFLEPGNNVIFNLIIADVRVST